MDALRLSGSIRRVTVLKKDGAGGVVPVMLYNQGSKKKKGTRSLNSFERATRRVIQAQRKGADDYLSRHEKSNEKRKDGWLRDIGVNSVRAADKGVRALKLRRLLSF